jgi:hypothetical protein
MTSSMVVFRCTRKLLQRVEHTAGHESELASSTTRLGDWYANVVSVRRQHVVLGVSGVTLLPVLLAAAPYKTMIPRFDEAAGQVLRALNVDEARIAAEQEGMQDFVVAKTNDRRVLGSMNDFVNMLEAYLSDQSLLGAALKLAESPCSPIGMKSPREATLALFSAPALRLVRS